MFKLIKKALTPKPSKEQMQTIIEGIHNEFDTAGEKLLIEAKAILAKQLPTNKGERLKKLGFSAAESAVKFDEISKERKEKEELAKLIEYYQTWYPSYKFITEKVVKSICEKYGLLSAQVQYYKGDVPEKNIAEMEAFKLRQEDMETRSNTDDYLEQRRFWRMMNMSSLGGFSRSERRYPDPPTDYSVRYIQPSFVIAAPEKDFDTRLLIRNGHKLELHIPDPIVMQPVKGGYLIVSKWGLEAEDAELTNEKMN